MPNQELPNHEQNEANAKGLMWFGISLSVGAILMHVALTFLFFVVKRHLEKDLQAHSPSETQTELTQERTLPPLPRLQENPQKDLQSYFEKEKRLLSSYGWVNQKEGIVHVPVDRAIDLYMKSGKAGNPKKIQFEQHLGAQLPLHTLLIDEYGESHTLKDYLGRVPLILVFSYYRCPNLCNLILDGLVNALHQMPRPLGKKFQILTLSIHPLERPPLALAKKRSYLAKLGKLENHGIEPITWHFLSSPPHESEGIPQLADVSGFHYFKDPRSDEYAHPSGLVIVTPRGKISQYFFGIQFDPKSLQQAILQAQEEKTGSWIEEILLYCFHYDPQLTRNGPLIIRIIQWVGIGSVLGMMIGWIFLLRSKRWELRR